MAEQEQGLTEAKKRILASAMEEFSSKGYRGSTTKEIASRAEVNELTLFRHFGSKENLLSEAIDHHFDFAEIAGTIPHEVTGDPEEDLVRTIRFVRTNIRKRRSLYRLMLRESATNDIVDRKLKELPGMIKVLMVERMEAILSGKVDEDFDHETAAIFLISYFLRSEMMAALMGEDPFQNVDEARIRTVVRMFLYGALPWRD
jgi:TetR/AcrR family transcriptional regulator, mexJK operon transcriptional repressor